MTGEAAPIPVIDAKLTVLLCEGVDESTVAGLSGAGILTKRFGPNATPKAVAAADHILVVWLGLQSALAAGLSNGVNPGVILADWQHSATSILAAFHRNRRKVVLAEAEWLAGADDAARVSLAAKLGIDSFPAPLSGASYAKDDFAAALAALAMPELQPLMQELQASSYCIDPPKITATDLDRIAGRMIGDTARIRDLKGQVESLSMGATAADAETDEGKTRLAAALAELASLRTAAALNREEIALQQEQIRLVQKEIAARADEAAGFSAQLESLRLERDRLQSVAQNAEQQAAKAQDDLLLATDMRLQIEEALSEMAPRAAQETVLRHELKNAHDMISRMIADNDALLRKIEALNAPPEPPVIEVAAVSAEVVAEVELVTPVAPAASTWFGRRRS